MRGCKLRDGGVKVGECEREGREYRTTFAFLNTKKDFE